MAEYISSLQNQRIKDLVRLQEKSAERRKQNRFLIEGAREINLALQAGFELDSVFHCPELELASEKSLSIPATVRQFELTKTVFEKIAYREQSDGYLALAIPQQKLLQDLVVSKTPLLIILESVEKPGNLGAILRTADAVGADAVIVCDTRTDVYNPNAIRSSVGCVFTVPTFTGTNEEVMIWLKEKGIQPYAAALTATEQYHQTDFKKGVALVFGTEADGLTDFWLTNAPQIKIPMLGKIDSLNVSNSVAIMAFEAKRQRNFR